jgi:hypothetical protein
LAKFRGWINAEYSPVIGKIALLSGPSPNLQGMGFFQPITGLYSALITKPRNFAKRQCKLQWLTSPTIPLINWYAYHIFFSAILKQDKTIEYFGHFFTRFPGGKIPAAASSSSRFRMAAMACPWSFST